VIGGELEADGDVLAPETRVGEFRIRSLLGEGAMGQVYLAQDMTLGRRVALKLIKRSMMRADGVERFLQEARATASVSHPNIVTLHAVGEYDGRPFLALEYVDGDSLRMRISAGALPVREALRIGRAIAEALAEAHRAGLVHSDLKPENVVIPRDGRVRVVDFGLARLVGTTSDSASGTPAYMAPERWRGHAPSGAIDIWAFGLLLHEVITGSRPIADTMLAQLAFNGATVAPYTGNGAPWSGIVAGCLALDPAARPTADELVRRLSLLLDPRAAVVDVTRCPFPGLAAFTRADAAAYFGRRGELDTVIETLRRHPLVPIAGPSGTGKSSFVYAALIPRLDDTGPWTVCALRPGALPFVSLAAVLGAGPADGLAMSLRRHPESLSLHLGAITSRTRCRVLLFIDQFEETFTLAADDARAFCDCLAIAALADEPWRIVITIRDDFFGRLSESPPMRALLGAVLPLARLSTSDLRAAILGPLGLAGFATDAPALVDRIVADVEHQPACLPLLQFTCQSLWDRRDNTTKQLVTAAYDAMGGASGALAAHAQQLIGQLSSSQVRLARKLLLALLNPDGTRRPRLRAELLDGLPGEASDVIDSLLERRLLVSAREPDAEGATLEVAHESLSTAWPQLARWLDETYEERLLVAQIEQASQLWERRGKRDDETWTGAALQEAIRRTSDWNLSLPEPCRGFLAAGKGRARRLRRRRRGMMWIGTCLLAGAAITAALIAVVFARKQTQIDLAGRDMGEFELRLDIFDWNPATQTKKPPIDHFDVTWELHDIDANDEQSPGRTLSDSSVLRDPSYVVGSVSVTRVQARSGAAYLKVMRGRSCAPSWVHLKRLPGYRERQAKVIIEIPIPTCEASLADTVEVLAGEFYYNVEKSADQSSVDEKRFVSSFRIDRTEVTRGAFAIYDSIEQLTGDASAPSAYVNADKPDGAKLPVVGVNFFTARNYCRYNGKDLPDIYQWQKSFRGGISVNGIANPDPKRLFTWLATTALRPANLGSAGGEGDLVAVGSFKDDTSPYGLVDLAGNVSEWTSSMATSSTLRGLRIVLGADWGTPEQLGHQRITFRNTRPDRYLDFAIGVRCAMSVL
jgi:formylglycine-generating enzyme required for sulfatase activity